MTKFTTMIKGMHDAFHKATKEFVKTEGLTQEQLMEAMKALAAFHQCMDKVGQRFYEEFVRLENAKLYPGFLYTVPYDNQLHAMFGGEPEMAEVVEKAGGEIMEVKAVQFQGFDRFLFVYQMQRGLQAPFLFEGTKHEFDVHCRQKEITVKVVDLIYIPE